VSQVLTAAQICEQALRNIGAFPVTDSAADGEQLRQAMTSLDLIMAQIAGTNEIFFLVQQQLPIPIINGTGIYDLANSLGANFPIEGTQFPLQAWLFTGDDLGGINFPDSSVGEGAPDDTDVGMASLTSPFGPRCPLRIATRSEFNSTHNPGETGPPRMIYIDRLPEPTLKIFPTPDVADTETYTILIDLQTYAPNVAPGGVTGTQASGSVLTKFRQAWQRHLIYQLSHDLGSGAIFKIGESSLNRFGKLASQAKLELEAFENREHDDAPPICDAYDGSAFYDHHFDNDRVRRG
jgi:hypothetical protein